MNEERFARAIRSLGQNVADLDRERLSHIGVHLDHEIRIADLEEKVQAGQPPTPQGVTMDQVKAYVDGRLDAIVRGSLSDADFVAIIDRISAAISASVVGRQ